MIKSTGNGGIMITGEASARLYRLMALRSALGLECKGLKMSRGRSAYAVIKREFGLSGNKAKVLEKFTEIVDVAKASHDNSV